MKAEKMKPKYVEREHSRDGDRKQRNKKGPNNKQNIG